MVQSASRERAECSRGWGWDGVGGFGEVGSGGENICVRSTYVYVILPSGYDDVDATSRQSSRIRNCGGVSIHIMHIHYLISL